MRSLKGGTAISRQREYKADVDDVLFTRYPERLANALRKLADDTTPLNVSTKGTADP